MVDSSPRSHFKTGKGTDLLENGARLEARSLCESNGFNKTTSCESPRKANIGFIVHMIDDASSDCETNDGVKAMAKSNEISEQAQNNVSIPESESPKPSNSSKTQGRRIRRTSAEIHSSNERYHRCTFQHCIRKYVGRSGKHNLMQHIRVVHGPIGEHVFLAVYRAGNPLMSYWESICTFTPTLMQILDFDFRHRICIPVELNELLQIRDSIGDYIDHHLKCVQAVHKELGWTSRQTMPLHLKERMFFLLDRRQDTTAKERPSSSSQGVLSGPRTTLASPETHETAEADEILSKDGARAVKNKRRKVQSDEVWEKSGSSSTPSNSATSSTPSRHMDPPVASQRKGWAEAKEPQYSEDQSKGVPQDPSKYSLPMRPFEFVPSPSEGTTTSQLSASHNLSKSFPDKIRTQLHLTQHQRPPYHLIPAQSTATYPRPAVPYPNYPQYPVTVPLPPPPHYYPNPPPPPHPYPIQYHSPPYYHPLPAVQTFNPHTNSASRTEDRSRTSEGPLTSSFAAVLKNREAGARSAFSPTQRGLGL